MERPTAEIIVKVYAILAWISALFAIVGAIFLFGVGALGGMGSLAGLTPEEAAAGGILAGLGVIIGAFLIVVAIFDIIVGWGLWTRKPWARIATIVMSVLSLVSFPVGTVIGAIGIWLFGFEETVKSLFTGAPAKAAPARAAPRAVKKRK